MSKQATPDDYEELLLNWLLALRRQLDAAASDSSARTFVAKLAGGPKRKKLIQRHLRKSAAQLDLAISELGKRS